MGCYDAHDWIADRFYRPQEDCTCEACFEANLEGFDPPHAKDR